MVTKTPTGLLSFLYHVKYDDDVNEYFHGSPGAVMTKFQLSDPEQNAITAMEKSHRADEATRRKDVEALMKILTENILQNKYPKIW